MLKATEMKVISEVAKATIVKQSIKETLEWCEACEEVIVYSANLGHTSANIGVPKNVINEWFVMSNRNALITDFFENLGYKVRFQNGFVLEW